MNGKSFLKKRVIQETISGLFRKHFSQDNHENEILIAAKYLKFMEDNKEVNSNKIKSILVLGKKGFIGKSVVEGLLNDTSLVVDGVSSVEIDLTDDRQVANALPKRLNSAAIVMAAAVTRDKDASLKSMLDNILMCTNVVSVINNQNTSHMIYVSTVDVYGRENLKLPLHESSELKPTNHYAVSKLTGEFIFRNVCREKNVPLTILRLPPVYGPGDTHHSPIANFMKCAIKKKNIELKSSESKVMNFLYIKDIYRTVDFVINCKIFGIYNLVAPASYSIGQIIRMIEDVANVPVKTVSYKGQMHESDMVFEKSALLEAGMGFDLTDLPTGIKETYKHYYKKINQDLATL